MRDFDTFLRYMDEEGGMSVMQTKLNEEVAKPNANSTSVMVRFMLSLLREYHEWLRAEIEQ